MDEVKLAEELQSGGVTLDDNYITVLLNHRDSVIRVEVPWDTASEYAMSDIMKHAAYLLARMRTHSPTRIRVKVEDTLISISAVE